MGLFLSVSPCVGILVLYSTAAQYCGLGGVDEGRDLLVVLSAFCFLCRVWRQQVQDQDQGKTRQGKTAEMHCSIQAAVYRHRMKNIR